MGTNKIILSVILSAISVISFASKNNEHASLEAGREETAIVNEDLQQQDTFQLLNKDLENGVMFRISGNGLKKPSYIFGTLHIIPDIFIKGNNKFDDAMKNVERVVTEIDLFKYKARIDSNMTVIKGINDYVKEKLLLPIDSQLPAVLGDSLYSIAKSFNTEYRLFENDFYKYDPGLYIIQALQISIQFGRSIAMKQYGIEPSPELQFNPIDYYIACQGKENGLEYNQLESLEYQSKLIPTPMAIDLSKITVNDELIEKTKQSLNAYGPNIGYRSGVLFTLIEELDKQKDYWESIIGYYNNQDVLKYIEMTFANGEIQNISDMIQMKERNERWIKKIPTFMESAPTMFAFGAGHLYSTKQYKGILNHLQEMGYKIEAVKL